jgi:hypothetical protein
MSATYLVNHSGEHKEEYGKEEPIKILEEARTCLFGSIISARAIFSQSAPVTQQL